jgi:threonine/homoserine/homoserine lactone efflux protein
MPSPTNLVAFALVALGMVLTPGPNMIYLISRSIIQGRVAGLISLGGVAWICVLHGVRGVRPHALVFLCLTPMTRFA